VNATPGRAATVYRARVAVVAVAREGIVDATLERVAAVSSAAVVVVARDRRVDADSESRIADPRAVAEIRRGAHHRKVTNALTAFARVKLGARVAVVAGSAVRRPVAVPGSDDSGFPIVELGPGQIRLESRSSRQQGCRIGHRRHNNAVDLGVHDPAIEEVLL
jgi:hypothetical protein